METFKLKIGTHTKSIKLPYVLKNYFKFEAAKFFNASIFWTVFKNYYIFNISLEGFLYVI